MKLSLAAARVNANLTQAQVATEIGVDKCTISKWECGKTAPKASQFIALCQLYSCQMDDIFLSTKST